MIDIYDINHPDPRTRRLVWLRFLSEAFDEGIRPCTARMG